MSDIGSELTVEKQVAKLAPRIFLTFFFDAFVNAFCIALYNLECYRFLVCKDHEVSTFHHVSEVLIVKYTASF